MYEPYPSSGQPFEPLRPPAPVRTAVKLMYAGAAVSTLSLIIALPVLRDIKSYHQRWNAHSLTAVRLSHVRPSRPWDLRAKSIVVVDTAQEHPHELCIDHGTSPH